jgi:omega-6 fatty acid desaturase (delta-12 desaturase)
MRTGKQIILATKPYAVDSSARSWGYVISTALLLGAVVAGTIWNFHLAGRLACSVLAGLLLLRLFVIYHDQQHEAILSGSRLAEALMRVFGIVALSPSSVWRSSHNHHHTHNSKLRGSHIGSFPIMTKAQYLKSSKATRFNYLFMRHPLTILFGYVFVFLHGMCVYPSFTKLREHFDCLIALLWHVLLAATILWYFGWLALLLCLVIPHFIASGIGSYLFYAQHNFPGVSFN